MTATSKFLLPIDLFSPEDIFDTIVINNMTTEIHWLQDLWMHFKKDRATVNSMKSVVLLILMPSSLIFMSNSPAPNPSWRLYFCYMWLPWTCFILGAHILSQKVTWKTIITMNFISKLCNNLSAGGHFSSSGWKTCSCQTKTRGNFQLWCGDRLSQALPKNRLWNLNPLTHFCVTKKTLSRHHM